MARFWRQLLVVLLVQLVPKGNTSETARNELLKGLAKLHRHPDATLVLALVHSSGLVAPIQTGPITAFAIMEAVY